MLQAPGVRLYGRRFRPPAYHGADPTGPQTVGSAPPSPPTLPSGPSARSWPRVRLAAAVNRCREPCRAGGPDVDSDRLRHRAPRRSCSRGRSTSTAWPNARPAPTASTRGNPPWREFHPTGERRRGRASPRRAFDERSRAADVRHEQPLVLGHQRHRRGPAEPDRPGAHGRERNGPLTPRTAHGGYLDDAGPARARAGRDGSWPMMITITHVCRRRRRPRPGPSGLESHNCGVYRTWIEEARFGAADGDPDRCRQRNAAGQRALGRAPDWPSGVKPAVARVPRDGGAETKP